MKRNYWREYKSYQSAVNGRKYWRSKGYVCDGIYKKRGWGKELWGFYCRKVGNGKRGWW